MKSVRRQIYAALFALLQGTPDVVTFGRVLKHFDDVLPKDQPALFLTQGDEQTIQSGKQGLPNKYIIRPDVYLYVHQESTAPGDVVGDALNDLLDNLDNLLQPDGKQEGVTLGGLVVSVRIAGEIKTDEGLLGPQAMAIVPLEVVVY